MATREPGAGRALFYFLGFNLPVWLLYTHIGGFSVRRIAVSAAAGLIACMPLFAKPQTGNAAKPSGGDPTVVTFRTRVQTVQLDVVVSDAKGSPVNDLKKGDFEVLQDGKPQEIRSFHPPSGVAATPSSLHSTADVDKQAPDAPVAIIVLDEISTPFEDGAYARYSIKKFLDAQPRPLPQATMLVAAGISRLVVLQDYTTDPGEILNALDRHMTFYPWGPLQDDRDVLLAPFATLVQLTQATMGHPGHKTVLWLGAGYRSFGRLSVSGSGLNKIDKAVATCVNMMRDARVTLYVVDPAGLKHPVVQAAQDLDASTGDAWSGLDSGAGVDLALIAQETGGKAYGNRNDVDAMVGKSAQSGREFYAITYNPVADSEDPKRFHQIRIVMKRPGLVATTRKGYFEDQSTRLARSAKDGQPDQDMVFDLSAATANRMVYDGLPLEVRRDGADPGSFAIHIREGAIRWQDAGLGARTANLALVIATYDKTGKLIDRASQTTDVKSPTASATSALNLRFKVNTATPAARIRFVVRSTADGRIGAENFYLVDPATISDPVTGMRPLKVGKGF